MMEEILDDELIGKAKEHRFSFIRWWEKRRLLFNLIVAAGPCLFLFTEGEIKMPFIYLAIVNLLYSTFSLASFLFKFFFEEKYHPNLYSFFQHKGLWVGGFCLQIFIIISLIIIIGGGSAEAPFLLLLF